MSADLDAFHAAVGTAASAVNRVPGPPDAASGESSGASSGPSAGPISAWAVNDDKYWGISHSIPTIEAGLYRPGISDGIGVFLQKGTLQTDALLRLPDSKSEAILAEMRAFSTMREAFKSRGFLYKRGFLLWGPPGSGKTTTLTLLMEMVIQQMGGIALLLDNPHVASMALQLVRKIEPTRQIIAVLEDFDGLIERNGESQYLSLLDGENQVDNIVFVATTNYPERIDRRFVDRPSRFDTVEYVGMPSEAARRMYFTTKEPTLDALVIEDMVAATEGLSIAHLREMIILTQCFGRSVADAGERLNASRHKTPNSERPPDAQSAGFGGAPRPPKFRIERIELPRVAGGASYSR